MILNLLNAWEISRKAGFTSTKELLSKSVCISCIIDSSMATHNSPWRKPNWECVKSLLQKEFSRERDIRKIWAGNYRLPFHMFQQKLEVN